MTEGSDSERRDEPDSSRSQRSSRHFDEMRKIGQKSSAEILSSLVGQQFASDVRKYRDAPRDRLKENIDPSEETRKYIRDLEKEHLKQQKQANRHREFLFWFCVCLVALSVASSSAIALGGTFLGSELGSATTVAFISGLSVQTLGVLWVIAKYLFAPQERRGSADPKSS